MAGAGGASTRHPPPARLSRKVVAGLRRIFSSPRPILDRLDYDEYWDARDDGVEQPRFEVIAQLVPAASIVADIGCGDGSLLRYLAENRGVKGWGVDISSRAVERAVARGLDCVVGDVTSAEFRLPPDTEVVIISEVLEHIPDPEAALTRIRLAGPGSFIVTIPNTGYIEHRLRLLFGRFPVQWLFHPGEHLRFWTIRDFQATAAATGFETRQVRPALGWFPFAHWMPSLFASQVIYVLEPSAQPDMDRRIRPNRV